MKISVKDMQPDFYKQTSYVMKKGYLSHAYLIEINNDIDDLDVYINFFIEEIYKNTYDENKALIKKEKLIYLIEQHKFPDFVEVYPINNQIKKDQLMFIKNDFVNKSLYGTKKCYVIYNSEKMNDSASNTILKFLEEPADDIIGIFVTNNRYNVLDTIRSRCQIISIKNEEKNINFSSDILSFVSKIQSGDDLLLDFNELYNNYFIDKQNSIEFIKKLIKYYKKMLNNANDVDLKKNVLIISIFDSSLNKLKYNVNMKLWIDDLLISLMEVK